MEMILGRTKGCFIRQKRAGTIETILLIRVWGWKGNKRNLGEEPLNVYLSFMEQFKNQKLSHNGFIEVNKMATELEYSIIERLSVDEENGRTI